MSALLERLGLFAWRICERPLTPYPSPPPDGIALRQLEHDELLRHCANEALGLDECKARASLARGEVCIGAHDGPSLVGYAWFAYEPAPHVDGIWMRFDPRAIYTYRAFVVPAYRGRGIAPALYRFADPLFMAHGRTSQILCIAMGNRSSLVAAQRTGARVVGCCAYLHAKPMFLHLRTPGALRVGYRFYIPPRDRLLGAGRATGRTPSSPASASRSSRESLRMRPSGDVEEGCRRGPN